MTKVYTVKKGDCLWNIAENELGDGFRYKEIMSINNLRSENLKIGQKLLLPSETFTTGSRYEKIGKQFEKALQDVSELDSVKTLLKMLEE